MKNTFMKSFLLAIVSAMFLCSTAWAMPVDLKAWNFDPDGASGGLLYVQDINEMLINGTSLKETTQNKDSNGDPIVGEGTFETYGAFYVTGFKNINGPINGTGLGNDYELTIELTTSGTYTTPPGGINQLTFTDVTMDFYVDTTLNWGTETTDTGIVFGTNDGDHIATFDLVEGTGNYDPTLTTGGDGITDVVLSASFLKTGVWFDDAEVDMSINLTASLLEVFGFMDSNNEDILTPTTAMLNEFNFIDTGLTYDATAYPLSAFVSSDGSMRLASQVVPEPSAMLLLGFGLLGIAGVGRKYGFKS